MDSKRFWNMRSSIVMLVGATALAVSTAPFITDIFSVLTTLFVVFVLMILALSIVITSTASSSLEKVPKDEDSGSLCVGEVYECHGLLKLPKTFSRASKKYLAIISEIGKGRDDDFHIRVVNKKLPPTFVREERHDGKPEYREYVSPSQDTP